jgi:hypothetical protein
MTRWIPVNDPPPPDDFHTWARPAPADCPDCDCCSVRLCETAKERGSSCRQAGDQGPGVMDLSDCPCAPMIPKEAGR